VFRRFADACINFAGVNLGRGEARVVLVERCAGGGMSLFGGAVRHIPLALNPCLIYSGGKRKAAMLSSLRKMTTDSIASQ
jgi:hypothetical protein